MGSLCLLRKKQQIAENSEIAPNGAVGDLTLKNISLVDPKCFETRYVKYAVAITVISQAVNKDATSMFEAFLSLAIIVS